MSELTREEALEAKRLNRHLNADPTTAKCIGGLRPASYKEPEPEPEPEEHNVRVCDDEDLEAGLDREQDRLDRHIAASKARAKEGGVIRRVIQEEPSYKCALCHKTGGGQFCMIELKRNPRATVHVDCFVCHKCGVPLAGGDYSEDKLGHVLCEDCAAPPQSAEQKKEDAPAVGAGNETCAKCKKPFTDGQSKVRAMGNMYHEKCFACDACGKPITSSCYKGEGGKLYCSEPCARRGYEESKPPAPKEEEKQEEKKKTEPSSKNPDDYKFCTTCGKELDGEFIVIGGLAIHRDCFVCSACGKKLTSQVYNVKGKMCCRECAEKADE